VDPLGLFWGEGTLDKWRHDAASDADAQWNAAKSFATGLVGTPAGCKTNQAAYDAGNVTWWADAIGGIFSDGATSGSGGNDGNAAPEVDGGSSDLAAPGGLSANDALFGGHVLSHVGLSDADLAARGLPEASSFVDRATAEASLADVQAANQSEIQAWLETAKPGATVAFAATFDEPVGMVLARGASQSVEGSTAIAVLRADPSSSVGYYLVTGYVAP
jgi:hypothetical protein